MAGEGGTDIGVSRNVMVSGSPVTYLYQRTEGEFSGGSLEHRLKMEADIAPELVLEVSGDTRKELEMEFLNVVEMVSQIILPTGICVLPKLTRVSSSGVHFAVQVFSTKMVNFPRG